MRSVDGDEQTGGVGNRKICLVALLHHKRKVSNLRCRYVDRYSLKSPPIHIDAVQSAKVAAREDGLWIDSAAKQEASSRYLAGQSAGQPLVVLPRRKGWLGKYWHRPTTPGCWCQLLRASVRFFLAFVRSRFFSCFSKRLCHFQAKGGCVILFYMFVIRENRGQRVPQGRVK